MRMKCNIVIMLFLACIVLFSTCADGGKQMASKRIQLEKQQKDNILDGKIGHKTANSEFKSAVFTNSDKAHIKIGFDDVTNSCYIHSTELTQVKNFFLVLLNSSPAAEYTIKNNSIVLNFSQYSAMISTITEDEILERCKKQAYANSKKDGDSEIDFEALWEKQLEKYGGLQKNLTECREILLQLCTEYLKYQPLEGTISEDKNTITFKKFAYIEFDHTYEGIVELEDVVFTRKK